MATRQKRDFWNRNLAAGKVREALESMGGDLATFEKAYAGTKRNPGPRGFTPEQVEAFRVFSNNGRNIESLASDLGVTVATARGQLARAMEQNLI